MGLLFPGRVFGCLHEHVELIVAVWSFHVFVCFGDLAAAVCAVVGEQIEHLLFVFFDVFFGVLFDWALFSLVVCLIVLAGRVQLGSLGHHHHRSVLAVLLSSLFEERARSSSHSVRCHSLHRLARHVSHPPPLHDGLISFFLTVFAAWNPFGQDLRLCLIVCLIVVCSWVQIVVCLLFASFWFEFWRFLVQVAVRFARSNVSLQRFARNVQLCCRIVKNFVVFFFGCRNLLICFRYYTHFYLASRVHWKNW